MEFNNKCEEIIHLQEFRPGSEALNYKFSFAIPITIGEMKLIIDLIKDMDSKGIVLWPAEKFAAYFNTNLAYYCDNVQDQIKAFANRLLEISLCDADPMHPETIEEEDEFHAFHIIDCIYDGLLKDGTQAVEVHFSSFITEPLLSESGKEED